MAIAKAPNPTQKYYVTFEGKVRGPFELQMIEALVLAEQFPTDVPISSVGAPKSGLGLERWYPLSDVSKDTPLARPEELKAATWKSPGVLPWMIGVPVLALILCATAIHRNPPDFLRKTHTSPETVYTPAPRTPVSPPPVTYTPPPANSVVSVTKAKVKANTDTTLYKDSSGKTYRVSNKAYLQLVEEGAKLDLQSASIDSTKKELEALNTEINTLKNTIDKTSQFSIDYFNKKVDAYNLKNKLLKVEIDSYNINVQLFNAQLSIVGTPVN